MKVLSLLQPWASLVVIGAKKIETRSWNTKFRGPLLIHASQRKVPEWDALMCSWAFHAAFHSLGGSMCNALDKILPFGAIVGMVNIEDVKPTGSFTNDELNAKNFPPEYRGSYWTERNLGDFNLGRFGWLLSNPVAFTHHLLIKGNRGLWDFDNRICLSCGCTDNDCRHCIEKTGHPCHWVAADLCSTCV